MAVYSQNGYLANDRSVTDIFQVTAAGLTMRFRKGPCGLMLAHNLRWFDENIRNIDGPLLDDWSYAERPVRGTVYTLSNHASGTADDKDATKWPLGSDPRKYLTDAEIARYRDHLKLYEGCIRWGGDYTGRKDPMHDEINKDEATVARVWAKITGPGRSPIVSSMQWGMHFPADQRDGLWGPTTDRCVWVVRQAFYGQFPDGVEKAQQLVGTAPSGVWTADVDHEATMDVVAIFQRAWGIDDDGWWGPTTERTWKAFQTRYYRP